MTVLPIGREDASGENLAWLLRSPDHWPKDFSWEYGYFSHCAMGLSMAVWGEYPADVPDEVYYGLEYTGWKCWLGIKRKVTAEMVAEAIDRHLWVK